MVLLSVDGVWVFLFVRLLVGCYLVGCWFVLGLIIDGFVGGRLLWW